jgi:hypothetical protein
MTTLSQYTKEVLKKARAEGLAWIFTPVKKLTSPIAGAVFRQL